MSNKPILVRKQIAAPAQQFQSIGADKTPSFMDLARTAFAPRGQVKVLPRVASLAGMAGKGAAAAATALQTAHQLQGGNLAAPLGAQYTYEGYDPSRAVSRIVNPVIDERKQGREAAQQESERLIAQRNQRETAQRRALGPQQITTSTAPTNVPLPTIDGTANTAYTGTAPTTAPAISTTMSPQAQAGTAMSGNPPQQTGPMMSTQAPPAGNQSLVQPVAEQLALTTGQPTQTPGGPAVPQQTPGVQQQLQIRPSGPQGALPPDPNSAAQQRGPPPAQQQGQQEFNPQQPLDPSMFPTNLTDAQAYSAYQRLQNPNQLQTSNDFVHDLFNTMGTYLYKMTPEEAGAFAVDAYFKMRE
tara:strand:+ start:7955 stop:9025 length:1071 start_codon:yes stop_codon:yes gene_type:complete